MLDPTTKKEYSLSFIHCTLFTIFTIASYREIDRTLTTYPPHALRRTRSPHEALKFVAYTLVSTAIFMWGIFICDLIKGYKSQRELRRARLEGQREKIARVKKDTERFEQECQTSGSPYLENARSLKQRVLNMEKEIQDEQSWILESANVQYRNVASVVKQHKDLVLLIVAILLTISSTEAIKDVSGLLLACALWRFIKPAEERIEEAKVENETEKEVEWVDVMAEDAGEVIE